jgi:hypothetical protein
LWNPHTLAGTPFLANCQSALFYPPNILWYLIPAPAAWVFGFLFRLFCAALGMLLYTRFLGMSPTPSLIASLTFTLSGFLVAWNGWPLADSAVWLPWLFLSVDWLREQLETRRIAAAAAAFALPVLGGHPEVAFYVCAFGGVYAAFRAFLPLRGSDAAPIRFLMAFSVVAALAVGLAAVQLFPAIEWIPRLDREFGGHVFWGSRSPSEMVGFVSRDARGNPNSAGVHIPEAASYVGAVGIVAAILALLFRPRREVVFFAISFFIAWEIIFGFPPFFQLSTRLPVLASLPNWRLLVIADFCVAMLAGYGLERLSRASISDVKERLSIWGRVLGSTAIAVFCGIQLWSVTGKPSSLGYGWVWSPAMFLVLVLLTAVALSPLWSRHRHLRNATLIGIAVFDLATYAYRHIPFYEAEHVFIKPPLYQWLAANTGGGFRVATVDSSSPSNMEIVYGLSSPVGYDFATALISDVLRPLAQATPMATLDSAKLAADRSRILDLLAVKYLITTSYNAGTDRLRTMPDRFREVHQDQTMSVFENLSVIPPAQVVPLSGGSLVAEEGSIPAVTSPGFDPARVFLVYEQSLVSNRGVIRTSSAPGTVSDFSRGTNSITFFVRAAEPSMAVISDTFYPGWRAEVGGRRTDVVRVNHAFKGVVVPAGEHYVKLTFLPGSFLAGAAVSAVALAAVLFMVFRRGRGPRGAGAAA